MGNLDNSLTFRLFARPSFLEGASRLIDFGNNLQVYNRDATGVAADTNALRGDWCMVGQDMKAAISEYAEEPSKE